MFKKLILLSLSTSLVSCGTIKIPDINLPMINGSDKELSAVPRDALDYQCEKNRHFYVKSLEAGKEMCIIFPDR